MRRRRAFTLTEVAVTAALAALMAITFYQAMAASSRRYRQGESGLEAVHEAQRILELLRHDLERPLLWQHPCDYPMDALAEMGVQEDRQEFATRDRNVARWFSYYQEGEGPIRETTAHLAVNFWALAPNARCRLTWPLIGPYWKHDPPVFVRPPVRDLRGWANPRGWIEFVPYPEGRERGGPAGVWMIGPAVWVFRHDRGEVLRYSPSDGIHRFGAGRLTGFAWIPTEEIAADLRARPKRHWASRLVKRMLRGTMTFRRDAGRPPLVVETTLTHHTEHFLPPPEAPAVAPRRAPPNTS